MTIQYTSLTVNEGLLAARLPAESLQALWQALWTQNYISNEELELCRLNLGRLHGLSVECDAINGHAPVLNNERKQAVVDGRALSDEAFSDREKALLLFTEYYWLDTQSITDEVAQAVKAYVGDAGLVFLIEALGCMDMRIRAAACLSAMSACEEDGLVASPSTSSVGQKG